MLGLMMLLVCCYAFGNFGVYQILLGGEHGYIYVLAENGDLETRLEVPGSEITGLSIRYFMYNNHKLIDLIEMIRVCMLRKRRIIHSTASIWKSRWTYKFDMSNSQHTIYQ